MALFDDRRFLLSHINHSFITGDDTGICEVVMLDKDVFENQHQRCLKLEGQNNDSLEERLAPEAYDLDYESGLFESEQGQSYDIASDLEYICHRRRSNTAQRLDRMTKEKSNQSRTRTIVWHYNSPTNSQSEERLSQDSPTSIGESTEINKLENGTKPNSSKQSRSPPRKSGLTRLLEKFPSLPKNPFDEFAQFDGGMSESIHVRKINIFMAINQYTQQTNETKPPDSTTEVNNQTNLANGVSKAISSPNELNNLPSTSSKAPQTSMIPSNTNRSTQSRPKKNEPLEIVIVSSAKVRDLIGLICWQYTNEGREPKLQHDINRYCLRIAEDNGEVDPDFGSLNSKEPLSKFNFPSLALTETTGERVGNYNDQYANGNTFSHRQPSITPKVIKSTTRNSNGTSTLAALMRMIFKDATLDTNQ